MADVVWEELADDQAFPALPKYQPPPPPATRTPDQKLRDQLAAATDAELAALTDDQRRKALRALAKG